MCRMWNVQGAQLVLEFIVDVIAAMCKKCGELKILNFLALQECTKFHS